MTATQNQQSFKIELAVTAGLVAAAFALAIVNKKSGLTLTLWGHAAFLLLVGVIVVAWRRFSAAVARGDLVVACLAGVRFAILFVYLIDDIVREAFVRIAVLGEFGFGIPNFSDRLRPIAYESVLAFLIAAALLVIWRLWQATRSPGP